MKVHFGLESHSDPMDQDDGTDEFIIAKYRADINNVDPPPEISISKLERAIVQHFLEIKKQHQLLEIIEDEFIHHTGDLPSAPEEKIGEDSDNAKGQDDTGGMNDITREELDAKLDATNARLEARLSAFEGVIRDTLASVRQDSAEARGELRVIHSELGGLKNIKGMIWGAAGATIIGVGGILAAMLSFGVANYDSGRETSQLVEAAKQQTLETKKLLEQMQTQQKSIAAPLSPVPTPPEK